MFRLLFVAVVTLLVTESLQKYTTKEPDPTEEGDSRRKRAVHIGGDVPCNKPVLRCWTRWFSRDGSSTNGDYETLSDLHKENPGKICPKPSDIDVLTVSGQTVEEAGELIYKMDTSSGFICRNKDQPDKKCQDYKVRFSCPEPFCEEAVCWTTWFNFNDASGYGDWELIKYHRSIDQVCENPLYIEVVTKDFLIPAENTGETFYIYNPSKGFACRNKDQKWGSMCSDYKVRYGCKC